jgi:hypothetical protein
MSIFEKFASSFAGGLDAKTARAAPLTIPSDTIATGATVWETTRVKRIFVIGVRSCSHHTHRREGLRRADA